jgi:hypothetical protein
MQAAQAELLLRALGNHGATVQDGEGPWVVSPCPLAPFTHSKGKDSNPSFAINLEHDTFNCFACHGGTLSTLFQLLLFHLQEKPEYGDRYDLKTINLIISGAGSEIAGLPQFTEFPVQQVFEPFPMEEVTRYTPVADVPRAVDYLVGRQCPKPSWSALGLRYDYKRDMIVTPYYTADGLLAGMRGRSVDPHTPDAYKHHDYKYQGRNNAAIVWCNEWALAQPYPVLVVEGQFDMAQCREVWPGTMANLTAKITDRKLRKLLSAPCAVFMLDNDPTGRAATEKAMQELQSIAPDFPCFNLHYDPKHKDPDAFARADPKGFKETLEAMRTIEVQ